MSVARCREINARLRAAGITVREWPGWESRGNGLTSAYEGCIVHHTASPYGPTYAALVTGRADLAGPLCNYGGNEDGSVTIVAAHPANHAGASGGRSMGPLPTTRLFNPRVMGLEIVYPGTSPMRPAQYRTACIWARIVTDVLGYGDIQRARAHAETSVTGKFDPGYAPNRTINMAQFRSDALAALAKPLKDDLDVREDDDTMGLHSWDLPAGDPVVRTLMFDGIQAGIVFADYNAWFRLGCFDPDALDAQVGEVDWLVFHGSGKPGVDPFPLVSRRMSGWYVPPGTQAIELRYRSRVPIGAALVWSKR